MVVEALVVDDVDADVETEVEVEVDEELEEVDEEDEVEAGSRTVKETVGDMKFAVPAKMLDQSEIMTSNLYVPGDVL